MKIPKIFVPEKNLENKTKELLAPKDHKKIDITFSDYEQIRYTTEGTNWAIEYEEYEGKKKWALYDKDFYENRWFENNELDERAKSILRDRIRPLVDLFNLEDKAYSVEKDNFKAILDRHSIKVLESEDFLEDQEHGKYKIALYEEGSLTIELKEFERIRLGKMDVLE